jgi:hypothetical protein
MMNLKGVERGSHGLIKGISQYLCGGTEENHEKTFRIVSVLAEIQARHLLNTSQKCYNLSPD